MMMTNDGDDDDDDDDDVFMALVSTVSACVVCTSPSGRSSLRSSADSRCNWPFRLIRRSVVYSILSNTSLSVLGGVLFCQWWIIHVA